MTCIEDFTDYSMTKETMDEQRNGEAVCLSPTSAWREA